MKKKFCHILFLFSLVINVKYTHCFYLVFCHAKKKKKGHSDVRSNAWTCTAGVQAIK